MRLVVCMHKGSLMRAGAHMSMFIDAIAERSFSVRRGSFCSIAAVTSEKASIFRSRTSIDFLCLNSFPLCTSRAFSFARLSWLGDHGTGAITPFDAAVSNIRLRMDSLAAARSPVLGVAARTVLSSIRSRSCRVSVANGRPSPLSTHQPSYADFHVLTLAAMAISAIRHLNVSRKDSSCSINISPIRSK